MNASMSKRSKHARRKSGITLIEMMVAMAILAIVATLMYTGFTQTSRNKKRVEADLERNHEVRMGIERIARELSMAFMSAQLNDDLSLQVVRTGLIAKETGGGSRVDFTSFSHQRLYRDAHESDQNELSYFIADDPDDSRINVLARREQSRIDDDFEKGGRTQILIREITGFELSFLEPLTGEWVSTWDTTQAAMQYGRMPSSVRIKVTIPSPSGKDLEFTTRTELMMPYALNHATYRDQQRR
jgi:general secretion pathway protein J